MIQTLEQFVAKYKSLRSAAEALAVPAQNLSWILRKVKGRTFVMEESDGVYTLLREVSQRGH